MTAFFKISDQRYGSHGAHVRLSEIDSVSDPLSERDGWVVRVKMRNGDLFTMSGDLTSIYKRRDELIYALEQDAKRDVIVDNSISAELELRRYDPRCSAVLKAQSKPYPRTCAVHGLSPCPPVRTEDATGD